MAEIETLLGGSALCEYYDDDREAESNARNHYGFMQPENAYVVRDNQGQVVGIALNGGWFVSKEEN